MWGILQGIRDKGKGTRDKKSRAEGAGRRRKNRYRRVGVSAYRGNYLELGTRNLELQPQAGV